MSRSQGNLALEVRVLLRFDGKQHGQDMTAVTRMMAFISCVTMHDDALCRVKRPQSAGDDWLALCGLPCLVRPRGAWQPPLIKVLLLVPIHMP